MGFCSLAGSGPRVGPKWVRGLFVRKIDPETRFGPTLGPLPANEEKPIFDPLLCRINNLTILARRELWS